MNKNIYCTPQEFSSKECEISNEIAKTQWLNNFHIFDKEYMSHISVTKNHKGELFLSSQKTTDDFVGRKGAYKELIKASEILKENGIEVNEE